MAEPRGRREVGAVDIGGGPEFSSQPWEVLWRVVNREMTAPTHTWRQVLTAELGVGPGQRRGPVGSCGAGGQGTEAMEGAAWR